MFLEWWASFLLSLQLGWDAWKGLPVTAQMGIASVAMKYVVKGIRALFGERIIDGWRVHGVLLLVSGTVAMLNDFIGLGFNSGGVLGTFAMFATAFLAAIGYDQVGRKLEEARKPQDPDGNQQA